MKNRLKNGGFFALGLAGLVACAGAGPGATPGGGTAVGDSSVVSQPMPAQAALAPVNSGGVPAPAVDPGPDFGRMGMFATAKIVGKEKSTEDPGETSLKILLQGRVPCQELPGEPPCFSGRGVRIIDRLEKRYVELKIQGPEGAEGTLDWTFWGKPENLKSNAEQFLGLDFFLIPAKQAMSEGGEFQACGPEADCRPANWRKIFALKEGQSLDALENLSSGEAPANPPNNEGPHPPPMDGDVPVPERPAGPIPMPKK